MASSAVVEQSLEALVDELSIGETRYEQACNSYKSLGAWLHRQESEVRDFDPQVYVQGSFRLGTAIRPLDESEEYDVDSVCELRALGTRSLSQETLKALVGREIKAYRQSRNMVKPVGEGRRCWTLHYADGAQFHMDIVPALPNGASHRLLLERSGKDARFVETAIVITDNESHNYRIVTDDWPRSNPKGFAEWFKVQMGTPYQRKRRYIADSIRANVEEVPEFKVRTPLQCAIMLLKRHRDAMFVQHPDAKPISIIITTLSAQAYRDEETIGDALLSILGNMERYIMRDGTRFVILNPADPLENFADKWEEHPERARAFFQWLDQARRDFSEALRQVNERLILDRVLPRMGRAAERAAARFSRPAGTLLRPASAVSAAAASAPAFPNARREPTTPQGFA